MELIGKQGDTSKDRQEDRSAPAESAQRLAA